MDSRAGSSTLVGEWQEISRVSAWESASATETLSTPIQSFAEDISQHFTIEQKLWTQPCTCSLYSLQTQTMEHNYVFVHSTVYKHKRWNTTLHLFTTVYKHKPWNTTIHLLTRYKPRDNPSVVYSMQTILVQGSWAQKGFAFLYCYRILFIVINKSPIITAGWPSRLLASNVKMTLYT